MLLSKFSSPTPSSPVAKSDNLLDEFGDRKSKHLPNDTCRRWRRNIDDPSESGVVRLVTSMVKDALSTSAPSISLSDVAAIGVGSPGVNDLSNGIIRKASNFPDWNDFAITSALSKELDDVPVYLENDANAALLAEVWIGAGKGCSDVVMMTLGTGVGGAVMSGGEDDSWGNRNGW